MAGEFDALNEITRKLIVPKVEEMVFRTSPFMNYMKKKGKEGLVEELVRVRTIARRYSNRVKMWHHNAAPRDRGYESYWQMVNSR